MEIGAILIGSDMQRTRAGSEALMLMVQWCFEAGYRRLEWTCDSHNEASMKAAERLGFTYECAFRQAYATKGRNRDKAIWAIIDKDWPALSKAYEKWLDPSNFDDAAQRTSLRTLTRPSVHVAAEAALSNHALFGRPVGPSLGDWSAPPSPPGKILDGQYARVIPFEMAHCDALYQANSVDDAIWDYMPQGPFADFDAYRDWMEANALGPDPMFHTIIDKADGAPAGVATYLRIAPTAGSIEVGYITYAPRLQRTRAGTEAMYLMMRHAFELGYRRYEWKCNALNAPSRRLAMRLGLSYEGIFRQAGVVKGRNRDTAWYAAIDSEWPALKDAFEAYLAPENFDDAGMQRQSLSYLTEPLLIARG
ncbi:MAG: GNAT family protein [Pseudomonadota bacterium]